MFFLPQITQISQIYIFLFFSIRSLSTSKVAVRISRIFRLRVLYNHEVGDDGVGDVNSAMGEGKTIAGYVHIAGIHILLGLT